MTHAFPTRSASDLSDIRAQEEITPAICCHIGYHQKGDRGYPRTDDIIGSENVEACGEPKINGCERQPRPRRCGYARHKAGGLMWLIICINIGIEARKAESTRSEEHTSELQSLMRISYAVFCLKKKKKK